MRSLRGHLLISNGGLFDPNFRHTVLLLAQHNEEGAVGVVLNRPLDVTVEEAVPPLAALVSDGEVLFRGGPVQPQAPVLLVELADGGLADLLVFGSVGFLVGAVSPDILGSVRRARVFAGYAGWGPGQLEAEMERNAWIVDPAREDDVFTPAPVGLWSRVLQRKGPPYSRLARMPFDPRTN